MRGKVIIFIVFFFFALVPTVSSKRGGAPVVEPVTCEGIKIIAPNSDGIREYVEIWDAGTKKKISEVTIFTNSLQPGLEKDVQWVFIEKLQCDNGNLSITDERGRQFHLDLKTKQITRLR